MKKEKFKELLKKALTEQLVRRGDDRIDVAPDDIIRLPDEDPEVAPSWGNYNTYFCINTAGNNIPYVQSLPVNDRFCCHGSNGATHVWWFNVHSSLGGTAYFCNSQYPTSTMACDTANVTNGTAFAAWVSNTSWTNPNPNATATTLYTNSTTAGDECCPDHVQFTGGTLQSCTGCTTPGNDNYCNLCTITDNNDCITWNCDQATNSCSSVAGLGGTHANQSNCNSACAGVATTFNCVNGACIDPLDGTGTYPCDDAQDPTCCNANSCTQVTYNCDPVNGCTDPGDGTGVFNDIDPSVAQADCLAQCVFCSEVSAKKCNGTSTRTFGCLTIDGYSGDPTGTTGMGTYTIGDYFEVEEKSVPIASLEEDILKEDVPDPGPNLVTYEVQSINNTYQNLTPQDAPSSECYPVKYACMCYHHLPCPDPTQGSGSHRCEAKTHPSQPGYAGGVNSLQDCQSWCPCDRSQPQMTGGNLAKMGGKDGCPGHTDDSVFVPASCRSFKAKPKDDSDIEPIEPIEIPDIEPIDTDFDMDIEEPKEVRESKKLRSKIDTEFSINEEQKLRKIIRKILKK